MSKLKALTLSILCAVLAVDFYMGHNTPFLIIAAAASLVFFAIWNSKRHRDNRIAAQAARERKQAARISQPVAQTSKDSHRLSVPPPLKEK